MKLVLTALAAVLLLLCTNCNQKHTTKDQLSTQDVTITELNKAPRTQYAPPPPKPAMDKLTPPVIKVDEEVRQQGKAEWR